MAMRGAGVSCSTVSDFYRITEGTGQKVFLKQKTAYGVISSLVGSEMCIRDRGDDADE